MVAAANHPQGTRLRQESVLIGPATIAGRLYRVSWFPALRPATGADDHVHGEVYRLADPARSLTWLDAYEGITPGRNGAEGGSYLRPERSVHLATGGTLTVWVYEYQRPLPEAGYVEDGIWRG